MDVGQPYHGKQYCEITLLFNVNLRLIVRMYITIKIWSFDITAYRVTSIKTLTDKEPYSAD